MMTHEVYNDNGMLQLNFERYTHTHTHTHKVCAYELGEY